MKGVTQVNFLPVSIKLTQILSCMGASTRYAFLSFTLLRTTCLNYFNVRGQWTIKIIWYLYSTCWDNTWSTFCIIRKKHNISLNFKIQQEIENVPDKWKFQINDFNTCSIHLLHVYIIITRHYTKSKEPFTQNFNSRKSMISH